MKYSSTQKQEKGEQLSPAGKDLNVASVRLQDCDQLLQHEQQAKIQMKDTKYQGQELEILYG